MNTTTIQVEQIEAQREQRFFNGIVKSAEFWANTEDMTMKQIVDFHKDQLKRHEINRERTIVIKTKIKHNRQILEIEGILAILEIEN
jgi:hypothetical protein